LNFDILIIGSGIVGSTAALALAKKTNLKIAILDSSSPASWQQDKIDSRVSAISLSSQRIFEKINVWEKISAKRVSPYTEMHVWDSEGKGEIHFDSRELNQPSLGCIIEDSVMRSSLHENFSRHENLEFFHSIKIISLQKMEDHVELTTDDGKKFATKLLIAADGANSWVRETLAIPTQSQSYHHTAIVATITTEKSHHKTARQKFLTTGPLAFLPLLNENQCSIVWSTTETHAENLMQQSEENFCECIAEAFEFKLGKILKTSQRFSFPLTLRHAKNYVQPNVALVGDAAHTIHPLAGQGVNMGLLDAASLVDVITETLQKNREFFSLHTLRKYERKQKAENSTMISTVDALKNLFSTENKSIVSIRNAGLNLTNRWSVIKNIFANYAAGNRHSLPELAQ
jgi:2-octaprenylphenol hydroxylase